MSGYDLALENLRFRHSKMSFRHEPGISIAWTWEKIQQHGSVRTLQILGAKEVGKEKYEGQGYGTEARWNKAEKSHGTNRNGLKEVFHSSKFPFVGFSQREFKNLPRWCINPTVSTHSTQKFWASKYLHLILHSFFFWFCVNSFPNKPLKFWMVHPFATGISSSPSRFNGSGSVGWQDSISTANQQWGSIW